MRIYVKVKPFAKENRIEKVDQTHFVVWVKEKPHQGRATEAAIKALAHYLGVAKSCLRLLQGESSRNKIIELI